MELCTKAHYRPGYSNGSPGGIGPNMMWAAEVPPHMSHGESNCSWVGNPVESAVACGTWIDMLKLA